MKCTPNWKLGSIPIITENQLDILGVTFSNNYSFSQHIDSRVRKCRQSYYSLSNTVKPVTRGHLKKCPYMTGVPSSQVHFNVKVHFGSQKMQFRHPSFDI